MATSRYENLIFMGSVVPTTGTIAAIRKAVASGQISVVQQITSRLERLDNLAGQFLGDARYWWVLAATSNIGWGLQVPAGTQILVPTHLEDVLRYVS
jgi:hypothetical protein